MMPVLSAVEVMPDEVALITLAMIDPHPFPKTVTNTFVSSFTPAFALLWIEPIGTSDVDNVAPAVSTNVLVV
jgi:hypothetical protein